MLFKIIVYCPKLYTVIVCIRVSLKLLFRILFPIPGICKHLPIPIVHGLESSKFCLKIPPLKRTLLTIIFFYTKETILAKNLKIQDHPFVNQLIYHIT